jgi:sulfite oxidase
VATLYRKDNTPGVKGSNDDSAHPAVHPDVQNIDNDKVFAEEREGWRGYIEWEDYPEKKNLAHKIMISHKFPPPPDFQLGPLPDTNPVLTGERWKLWHRAIGGPLTSMPEESWLRVIQEKHKDMLHVLEFPYNGESPKRLTTAQPITPNSLFFVRNHGGIPDIEAEKWDLKIDGLIGKSQTLTLKDIMDETRFPRVKKVATIQCSGTRRHEQIDLYPGEGDDMINAPWAEGAIGTAEWEGVTLKSVLKYCGGVGINGKGKFENGKMAHCELSGADTYFKQVCWSFPSIPNILTSTTE